MNELLYHLSTNAIEMYLLLRFFRAFFGEYRKSIPFVSIVLVVLWIAYAGINSWRNPLANLTVYLAMKVGIAFLFHGKWSRKLLAIFALTALLITTDLILFQLFVLLGHDMMENFYIHGIISLTVHSMIILWIVLRRHAREWGVHRRGLIIVTVIWGLIFAYAVLFPPQLSARQEGSVHQFFLVSIFLVLSLLVFFVFEIVAKQNRAERIAAETALQLRAKKKYYEQFEYYETEIRRDKHDMKNFLYGLIPCGEEERLKKIKEKLQNIDEAAGILYSENEVIQLLLHTKLRKIRLPAQQISVNCTMPNELQMDKTDLAILLGNILDNIVEALENIPESDRFLVLNFRYDPQYALFSFENTFDPRQQAKESRTRGFGIGSIRRIVAKYEGDYRVDTIGNRYCTRIRFPFI